MFWTSFANGDKICRQEVAPVVPVYETFQNGGGGQSYVYPFPLKEKIFSTRSAY